jgi:small subunit ribosomal protein S17
MADEKNDEKTEETPVEETPVEETPAETAEPDAEASEEVSDTEVPETSDAPEEPVSDTSDEAAVAEEAADVSDTSDAAPAAADETPAADEAPAADETPAAPVKPSRSQRHVPRTARRTRTKVVREKPATRKAITRTEKPDYERGRRQERRGVVVSDKADKTIIVKVDVIKSHPKYKKVIRSTVKFHAHDEANTAGVGDKVRIVETRPLSKLKHWRLAEIVEKAK